MRSLSRHVASTPQPNEPGGRGRPRRRGARFDPLHASRGSALAFLLAAAVVALWRADTPFAHGWWLVAYLALVGGCAQLLLGPGREWIATQIGATLPSARWRRWEIGLWNTGTFAVPAGVLTDSASPVLVGSVLLLTALALHAAGLGRTARWARRPGRGWACPYYALVLSLSASVFIGAGFAEALPWQ